MRVLSAFPAPLFLVLLLISYTAKSVEIVGERKLWHRITLHFEGPAVSEDDETNPFTDYRLDVEFRNGSRVVTVPGFYAADGHAGMTGASSGSTWTVHFAPEVTGTWSYEASFRKGANIAAVTGANEGESAGFCDGGTGEFIVAETDRHGRDFRAHGFLRHVGERYRRFSGSGEYFIKAGPGDPENFLGYSGFDNTPDARHDYDPHRTDWTDGDPTWRDGKGKEIIGMVNYLAGAGANTLYFLSWSGGDGKDAYPWIGPDDYLRYDCSKLDQWETVFQHMTQKGIHLHMFFFEHEIDMVFGGGDLNVERKIYFREIIARFAHNPGLTWNLGEELNRGKNQTGGADPTTEQIKEWALFIRNLDPYDHPIAGHPYRISSLYDPLLGFETFDVAALQTGGNLDEVHTQTLEWIGKSTDAGHTWLVENVEQGGPGTGIEPTDSRQNDYRKKVLWGNLMAGGAGVEYYFGSDGGGSSGTLNIEDMRLHDKAFVEAGYAVNFFTEHVPFHLMENADELVDGSNWCLASSDYAYLIYLPSGGSATLDISDADGDFKVFWFDPRNGGNPAESGVVTAGGSVSTGNPPDQQSADWAVLLIAADATAMNNPIAPPKGLVHGDREIMYSPSGRCLRIFDNRFRSTETTGVAPACGVYFYRSSKNSRSVAGISVIRK